MDAIERVLDSYCFRTVLVALIVAATILTVSFLRKDVPPVSNSQQSKEEEIIKECGDACRDAFSGGGCGMEESKQEADCVHKCIKLVLSHGEGP